MEQNNTPIPVSVELKRGVMEDLTNRFHPSMQQLSRELEEKSLDFRKSLEQLNAIARFSGPLSEAPVLGVDASLCTDDRGSFSVALSVGVASSTSDLVVPTYRHASLFGASSESFSRAANYLRVAMELSSLKYASETDQWFFYDGSFPSLNYEVCKFAASMTKESSERDLFEAPQLNDVFDEAINSRDSAWFDVFGGGAERAIAIGKQGTSTVFTDSSRLFDYSVLTPTDKMMLTQVLEPGEYTRPFSYEEAYQSSHGSEVPGYGKPSLKNASAENLHDRVLITFKSLRIVYFKPWPWSPVMKLEYNGRLHSVDEVLSLVAAQTQTRSLMEPLPLYIADLHTKQGAGAIKLYGSINAGRYPYLFSAYRTSHR